MASKDSSKQAPPLCANGCGFFANSGAGDMCSKCYRESQLKELAEKALNLSPTPVVEGVPRRVKVSASSQVTSSGKRCAKWNKKVGILGFRCRCENTYCGLQRHGEKHECTFDYKTMARNASASMFPIIKPDKLAKF